MRTLRHMYQPISPLDGSVTVSEWDGPVQTLDAETLARAKKISDEFHSRVNITIEDKVTISNDAREASVLYEQAKRKGIPASEIAGLLRPGGDNVEKRPLLLQEFGSTHSETGLQTTTKNGTIVGVYSAPQHSKDTHTKYVQITQKSGMQIQMVINGNMRINEAKDGSISILFEDEHKKMIYSPDGSVEEYADSDSSSGTSGDDIIINVNGTSIDGKEGDDILFNLADNATISGGDGNDTILLPSKVKNNTIDTGSGNDTVSGYAIENSNIEFGDGDNELSMHSIDHSNIHMANGNNKISTAIIYNKSSVLLGDGNNDIYTTNLGNDGLRKNENTLIDIGGGDNFVTINSFSCSTLKTGSGYNKGYYCSLDTGTIIQGKNTNILAASAEQFDGLIENIIPFSSPKWLNKKV